MNHSESQLQLLNLITRPAFYAGSGVITYANQAALAMVLTPGTALAPMLPFDPEELNKLTEGSLCTTLAVAGITHQVAVSPCEEGFLFLLDAQENMQSLRMLALAAQQLRVPLNELVGEMTQVFPQMQDASPEDYRRSRQMMQNMMQLLRIVGNMSDAQQYADQQAAFMEPVELGSLYDEIFRKVASLAESLGIHISFDQPKQAVVVWGDSQQIERCVLNLLANSLRFTPQGGTVHAQLQLAGRQAILRVQDSGEGLHEQIRSTLFDRYRREPAVEDSRYGLGLGLLLSRLIATNHGGALFIGPGRDGGTEAVLALPVRREDAGDHPICSMPCRVDYTGSWDHALVELSGVLPPEAMDYL